MTGSAHRPCLMLSFVLALGIMLGKWLICPAWVWIIISFIFLALYWFNRSLVFIYILVFLLGATWITQRNLLPRDSLAFLPYRQAIQSEAIEGIVASSEEMIVQVNQVLIRGAWQKRNGGVKLRVWGNRDLGLEYGTHVRIKGKLYPIYDMPDGRFSYRRYLQERGIFWMFSPRNDGLEVLNHNKGNVFIASANHARKYINSIYAKYLAPREAAFVSALVIGDRRSMPKDLKEVFVNTGTAHILAISGMNMAVIVTVFIFIFQLTSMPRAWKYIMTIIFLLGYAFISGWSPSVVRASLMSAVLMSSFAFEYEGEALNSLGVAALILLLLDPNNLFNIGFQLSFAAVAGILVLTKPVEEFLHFLPKIIGLPVAVSIAAFITTAGIIFFHFRMITPISILANIPIVPLADLVMILGLGLAIFSFFQPLAIVFAACLKAVLSAMIISALWFSKVPAGSWQF